MSITGFVKKVCVQTAVYWTRPTNSGHGDQTFSIGTEIACRWDGETKVITNKQGKEVTSMAKVMVTAAYDDAGYLYLGTLASLTALQQNNPLLVEDAYMIQKIQTTPLFKSTTDFVWMVYL